MVVRGSGARGVAIVAVALAVAAGAWAVDWYRDGLPPSSRSGDACEARGVDGGLVGLDATDGEQRWTNAVPPNGNLEVIEDRVHHQTLGHPDQVDRTLDDDGAVVNCGPIDPVPGEGFTPVPGVGAADGSTPDLDRLIPGANVGDLTIVPWGDGIRATDEDGRGVWGTTGMEASSLLGEDLLVQVHGMDAGSQAAARIDLRTGEARWEVPGIIVNAEGARSLVIVRDAAPSTDPTYRALDIETGTERWRTTLEDTDGTIDPEAWEAGDLVVFCTTDDGGLSALAAADGERRWATTVTSPAESRQAPQTGQVGDVATVDGATLVVAIDAYRPEDYVD